MARRKYSRRKKRAARTKEPKKPASVVQIPAKCPTCHHGRKKMLDSICTQSIAGKLPDGTEFQQVTWMQAECMKCGQRYRVRRYEKNNELATV